MVRERGWRVDEEEEENQEDEEEKEADSSRFKHCLPVQTDISSSKQQALDIQQQILSTTAAESEHFSSGCISARHTISASVSFGN